MKRPSAPALVALLAVMLALGMEGWQLWSERDRPRLCFNLDTAARPECFFSADYYQARDRFRDAARSAGAEIHALPIYNDLTTDIALFRAVGTGPRPRKILSLDPEQEDQVIEILPPANHGLMLHISGTHGVEGFVGSAVQLSAFKDPSIMRQIKEAQRMGVSVAVVHALNPYGMAYLRRFNEENVDLNRNALFREEDWEEVMARPTNIAGYDDISGLLNPQGKPYFGQTVVQLLQAVWQIITKGFVKVKAALVTGTYHCPDCVYFGGQFLQTSHSSLSKWLQRHFINVDKAPVNRLALVDVHSGLGPMGLDSLMDSSKTTVNLTEIFNSPDDPLMDLALPPYEVSGMHDSSSLDGAASGYDLVVGVVTENYPDLWPKDRLSRGTISVTQEFGTVPGIWVALACIQENQIWQMQRKDIGISRDKEALQLKSVFCPDSQSFRESVVIRGRSVFKQSLNWIMHG